MPKPKLLVVGTDENTRKNLLYILEKNFETIEAKNIIMGIDYARNQNPTLIIIDIVPPHLDAFSACDMLKKDSQTKHIPIITLSSNTRPDNITKVFQQVDDYIIKPFDVEEFLARVKNRLLVEKKKKESSKSLVVGDLKIDIIKRNITFKKKSVKFTLTEFDILYHLVQNIGEIVTRRNIIKYVKDKSNKTINNRTIDVHIRAIRKKLPEISQQLRSIYGKGYSYNK